MSSSFRQVVASSRRRVRGAFPTLGATAVEYALMVSLIALVIFAAVELLGSTLTSVFQNAAGLI